MLRMKPQKHSEVIQHETFVTLSTLALSGRFKKIQICSVQFFLHILPCCWSDLIFVVFWNLPLFIIAVVNYCLPSMCDNIT